MKKRIFIIATLLVVAATAFAIVSCKKDSNRIGQDNPSKDLVSQSPENMDEYLISFKKKLLSTQKSEETISVEQAQRDLGNLLNFDFGDANYATDELQRDTLFVPIDLAGKKVSMAQLAETYNAAFARILETYHQVELPEKSILSVSCLINGDAKSGGISDVRLILTSRGLANFSLKTGFDETDNWRVWERLGKCDGTCVGDDHVTMIEKVYRRNRLFLACNKGRLYYTDIKEGRCFHASDFLETNPNIHYNDGCRLWCGFGSEVMSHCVEYPEMQYYYNNFCQIMSNEAWRPHGHVIMEIEKCELEALLSVDPGRYYSFCCIYSTAKPNCTDEGLPY